MSDAATAAAAMGDDLFNDANLVPSNWVSFNVIGDFFKGTLMSREERDNTLQPGKKQWVYEFKMHYGEFHKLDDDDNVIEPAVKINADEIWMLGSKESIDKQMRNLKVGQVIGMKLTDITPAKTKGFHDFKNIKVYAGPMDDSFMQDSAE